MKKFINNHFVKQLIKKYIEEEKKKKILNRNIFLL